MKKTLTTACAVILLTACGGTANRTTAEQTAVAQTTQPATRTIVGGYTEQRDLKPEDLQVFESATAGLKDMQYTPQSVATQIVAGKNYRFICKAVTTTPNPQTYQVEVTIFEPLPSAKRQPIITSITEL